ncbi:MAG TPA: transglutaminase domain-containing protein [Candidatus Deferrimicrobiaceae bacterium]
MKMKNKYIKPLVFAVTIIFTIIFTLNYLQVDNSITEEDKIYIGKILQEKKVTFTSRPTRYEEEIELIMKIQNTVLEVAHDNIGIPYNSPREPKDLYLLKSGLCYDRSRSIEKISRYLGFKTRHISIYSTENTHSPFQSLITPKISSHAVTEVLTLKGWIVVDSNVYWISLDGQGNPVSIEQIQSKKNNRIISWAKPLPNDIYKKPFTFIYGLYSRHGRFYHPYNFVPDINYKELMQNIL